MTFYSTHEFARVNPKAFEALPEPYRADSCLEFYSRGEDWFCRPIAGEEGNLGVWDSIFYRGKWREVEL